MCLVGVLHMCLVGEKLRGLFLPGENRPRRGLGMPSSTAVPGVETGDCLPLEKAEGCSGFGRLTVPGAFTSAAGAAISIVVGPLGSLPSGPLYAVDGAGLHSLC